MDAPQRFFLEGQFEAGGEAQREGALPPAIELREAAGRLLLLLLSLMQPLPPRLSPLLLLPSWACRAWRSE